MDLPLKIQAKLEYLLKNQNLKELQNISKKISERYMLSSFNDNKNITSEMEAKVYANMRMPATFSTSYNVLNELSKNYSFSISSICDFGGGTGSTLIAVKSLFPNVQNLTMIERDKHMINISKELIDFEYKLVEKDFIKDDIEQSSDLSIFGYTMNEVSDNDLFNVIDKVWSKTNKALVIVDPGTPVCYKRLQTIKQYLKDKGGFVLAPCPKCEKCYLGENDWCHFVTRISRSKTLKDLKMGDSPFEDEKYTYLIVSKTDERRDYSRVLRHPQLNSGFVDIKLCTHEGVKNLRVTKSNKELYKTTRKAKSGDIISHN